MDNSNEIEKLPFMTVRIRGTLYDIDLVDHDHEQLKISFESEKLKGLVLGTVALNSIVEEWYEKQPK